MYHVGWVGRSKDNNCNCIPSFYSSGHIFPGSHVKTTFKSLSIINRLFKATSKTALFASSKPPAVLQLHHHNPISTSIAFRSWKFSRVSTSFSCRIQTHFFYICVSILVRSQKLLESSSQGRIRSSKGWDRILQSIVLVTFFGFRIDFSASVGVSLGFWCNCKVYDLLSPFGLLWILLRFYVSIALIESTQKRKKDHIFMFFWFFSALSFDLLVWLRDIDTNAVI